MPLVGVVLGGLITFFFNNKNRKDNLKDKTEDLLLMYADINTFSQRMILTSYDLLSKITAYEDGLIGEKAHINYEIPGVIYSHKLDDLFVETYSNLSADQRSVIKGVSPMILHINERISKVSLNHDLYIESIDHRAVRFIINTLINLHLYTKDLIDGNIKMYNFEEEIERNNNYKDDNGMKTSTYHLIEYFKETNSPTE